MTDLLILAAAELETRALARHLELAVQAGHAFPVHGRPGLRLAPVGIGAARLAERFPGLLAGLDRPLVVSAGVCGALAPALRRGDLVLPREVLGPGEERHVMDAAARARVLARVPASGVETLVTVTAVAATPAAKAELRARTRGDAVDMESAAIAGLAARAGCPALAVRAVSDRADEGLPAELLAVMGADGRLSLCAALGLLGRPRALPRALALGRATRRALAVVARALGVLVG